MTPTPSPNFAYLAHHDARLVALATQAEQHFAADSNVTLYKLRQFCEVLAKRAAAKVGLLLDPREDLHRVVEALFDRSAIGATQRTLFHQLRRAGNEAVHDLAGSQAEALHQLKVAQPTRHLVSAQLRQQPQVRSRPLPPVHEASIVRAVGC